MIKLIGILIVAVGFALRFNTLIVVVAAGVVTGLVSGISFNDIMTEFGQSFIENRYVSLPIILTLPIIGILERYGLKESAELFINKAKNATAGRVMMVYLFIRETSSALGLDIGGHAQAVRPLISPMATGAAKAKYGDLPEKLEDDIKAYAAVSENVGRFFGQDIFIATAGILLMKGFFDSIGMDVGVWEMVLWGVPMAVSAFLLSWWYLHRLDKRIEREMSHKNQHKDRSATS